MKKTLAAVAVLGAFAGSALAADVQLYGIVDTGFQYLHTDADASRAGYDATDAFSMESGMQSGSRFGFKGTEDLGNGLTVGFILEDGIKSDTGVDDDVMFNRESSLFIEGSFGKFAMGRLGSINGGVSSWGKYGMISAFGTSWGNYSAQAGNWAVGGGMWDNMIAYETPSFAGFKVFAQYGMGDNNNENESSSDRYYAIGATYANGPLNLYFAIDSINYQTADANGALANASDIDDSLTVTLGGNYDFEVVKIFAGAQYFDEVKLSNMKGAVNAVGVEWLNNATLGNWDEDDDTADTYKGSFASKMKGWSLGVSGNIPVAGGNVLVGAAYLDAEAADSVDNGDEMTRWIVSAGYDYPLSKRTDVYGVVTYTQDSLEYGDKVTKDQDPTVFGVMIGLRHKF